ncbi:peroxiredoxin [Agrobacterium sp. Ap1]|uniref:peroxiredoxin n=1 Tax=Agrobacterium sp. Ap1 TaxID=2815337 RepID=UPI001A8E5FEB|nr:peroxiredoxin [Agrobacterium sp. Ap1]MBO0144507.1 peroxiredoxin [Agrobacterium sp. Ap1]
MGIENLAAPEDDGEAAHLIGMRLPSITLSATDGASVDLSQGGLTVIYAYPRTSPASGGAIEGWDAIPGARGCTPQSCAFRDHFAELKALGVERLFGLSTQDTEYQKKAANRLHLPFPLLSDSALLLADALNLPLFTAGGMTLLKRLTLIIEAGQIRHVFYPVFPPDRNASDVIAWLSSRNS